MALETDFCGSSWLDDLWIPDCIGTQNSKSSIPVRDNQENGIYRLESSAFLIFILIGPRNMANSYLNQP